MADRDEMSAERLRRWMERLERRDPALHAELAARARSAAPPSRTGARTEAFATESTGGGKGVTLETIVREGRPALFVKDNQVTREDSRVDKVSEEMVRRVIEAAPVINPLIPLVGRIDAENHPSGNDYLGTAWLIDANVVVTNRHVAELFARHEGGRFVFKPGRFAEPLRLSLNWRREHRRNPREEDAVEIKRVIWIEPDDRKADIAFLEIGARSDGTRQDRIELAESNGEPDLHVAVIGYPARASADIIPDQERMDDIYGGVFDVKRVAPGQLDKDSRGWATHDCTTLGGNSGSVVVDMATGRAVGLHFAGLYMVENYAVPASTIRRYLRERPWEGGVTRAEGSSALPSRPGPLTPPRPAPLPAPTSTPAAPAAGGGTVTITVPLTITVSLGASGQPGSLTATATAGAAGGIAEAAAALAAENRAGVLNVSVGHVLEGARVTDEECIVVSASPDRFDAVQAASPSPYLGYPVVVRPASIEEQLGIDEDERVAEAVSSIAYDDDARTGPQFSFEPIEEEMEVLCHVGPEASWATLRDFLAGARSELVSSIYEFHAGHVADAIEQELKADRASLRLVLDPASRDGKTHHDGEFDRSERFARWESDFKFDNVFVPTGGSGLVANAYHIKVTVRDRESVWLSSGNWTRTSQPNFTEDQRRDPRELGRAGNREWHVVVKSPSLAERMRSHIEQDFTRARELGGTPEAVIDDIYVDVPATMLESVVLEAAPSQVLEPELVGGRIRMTPLLTPDRVGRVYTDAVLELIRSARRQLVFQNQYIKIKKETKGNLGELVDALIERSREIEDVRIILRSGGKEFWDNASELKRRGLDITRCVRRMPRTHTKGIVVDGKRVLIGSHNWSGSGVTLNRDASLIFDHPEIADYYLRSFEVDWERASPLTEESAGMQEFAPRLAGDGPPPPGFARVRLSEFLEG